MLRVFPLPVDQNPRYSLGVNAAAGGSSGFGALLADRASRPFLAKVDDFRRIAGQPTLKRGQMRFGREITRTFRAKLEKRENRLGLTGSKSSGGAFSAWNSWSQKCRPALLHSASLATTNTDELCAGRAEMMRDCYLLVAILHHFGSSSAQLISVRSG